MCCFHSGSPFYQRIDAESVASDGDDLESVGAGRGLHFHPVADFLAHQGFAIGEVFEMRFCMASASMTPTMVYSMSSSIHVLDFDFGAERDDLAARRRSRRSWRAPASA